MSATVKLEPIEVSERLYVRVARRIAGLVESGQVKPGEKLPSERDLANMLKVSRPSIREAMIALEVSGLIEVRMGAGIYVREGSPGSGLVKDEGIGPFEILELRLMIEPEAAALAAERMPDSGIEILRAILAEMETLEQTAALETVDQKFHVQIARGTENAATVEAIEWLWGLRRQSEFSSGFHQMIIEEGVYPAIEEHRAIVDAIAARDANAARVAMRTHLEVATKSAATHFGTENA